MFERHCHRKYELLYVARGRGKCIVEGSEYPLSDGVLFVFRPFEYHYVCPDPDSAYERYVCNFSESVLASAVRELPMMSADSKGLYFSDSNTSDNFCNIILNLESFFEKNDPKSAVSEAMAISAVNQILLLASQEKREQNAPLTNGLVEEIIAYLNRHIEEKVSLDDAAKRFFISKYYLCRLFKKSTGVTVLSYLNSKRIAKAQHLIATGEPPTSVAYSVGFGDYSSFYRAYVKETGKAPSVAKSK